MKTLFTLFILLAVSTLAHAGVPRAPVVRPFACNAHGQPTNIVYSLEVTTQAMAPGYAIRGITLVANNSIAAPGSLPPRLDLRYLNQDDVVAVFASDDPLLPNLVVRLDKRENLARIYRFGRLTFTCSEVE